MVGVTGIAGNIPSVTEARHAFLLRLSDTLWPLSDPVEIQAAAACCLGEHLCANRVLFMEIIDEKELIIDNDFATGVASMAGRYCAEFFGTETVARLRSGGAVIVDDIASVLRKSDPIRQKLQNAEVASFMMVGMTKGGCLTAAFGAQSATPRVWTESEISLLRDTAERTWTAIDRVRTSLLERDAFRRRVQHRVKNDLQLIASLLNLQANQTDDSRLLAVLEKNRNRVYSIATVYDFIYRAEDLARIDMAAYAKQLVPELVRFHNGADRVKVTLEIDSTTMEMERAVPFGLLLNELVSNSCTHAFPEGRYGEITIRLRREDQQNVLTVADNGMGFPVGFDFHQAGSLGSRLVHMLAQELAGEVEVLPACGVHILMRFPVSDVPQEAGL